MFLAINLVPHIDFKQFIQKTIYYGEIEMYAFFVFRKSKKPWLITLNECIHTQRLHSSINKLNSLKCYRKFTI